MTPREWIKARSSEDLSHLQRAVAQRAAESAKRSAREALPPLNPDAQTELVTKPTEIVATSRCIITGTDRCSNLKARPAQPFAACKGWRQMASGGEKKRKGTKICCLCPALKKTSATPSTCKYKSAEVRHSMRLVSQLARFHMRSSSDRLRNC